MSPHGWVVTLEGGSLGVWEGSLLLLYFSGIRLLVTPWTVAHQAPLSTGFSRQEYWSGLPCPPSRDLPDPGIELVILCLLLWQLGSLPLAPPGSPLTGIYRTRQLYFGILIYFSDSDYFSIISGTFSVFEFCFPWIINFFYNAGGRKEAFTDSVVNWVLKVKMWHLYEDWEQLLWGNPWGRWLKHPFPLQVFLLEQPSAPALEILFFYLSEEK